ncbi:MAG: M16 family metallopeptidase [Thermoplasmata archaeon]
MARGGVNRPRVEHFRLPNGLEVLLAPEPTSPTASVWVWYRVGSKNEHPGITGASHWVEHMLFQGSPRYGKGEVDRAVVEVGGALNAFTSYDFTAYYSTVPRAHLAVPLDIEADRLTRALITDREVDRERTVVLSEREGNENWPEFRASEELYELAFRRHPYRWDALGYRRDIESMNGEHLREYYHRFYGPRNAVLVIAGGFEPATVRTTVRRRFGRLPAVGEDPRVADVEPPPRGERRSTLRGPGTTPFLDVAFRAPSVFDPSAAATMMLDTVLGGESRLFGGGSIWGRAREHPSSRLYRSLVDPGLAVRATSEWQARVHPSLFEVHAQASAGVTLDRLEDAVHSTLRRLSRDGPTAAEVEEARVRVRRGAGLSYEGSTRTGFRLGLFATLRSTAFEDELYRALLKVRPPAIRDVARALFREEARVVVRYEPSSAGAA